MKEIYNDLFNGKLDVEKVGNDSALIGDEDYLFCEIDGLLCHEDGKAPERAEYIANATNNFSDMYEMLENIALEAKSYQERSGKVVTWLAEAESLLKRARGE